MKIEIPDILWHPLPITFFLSILADAGGLIDRIPTKQNAIVAGMLMMYVALVIAYYLTRRKGK